jgi:hypothetical protein
VPNPLAIGVTFGGLLLDLIAPRPKPRAGYPHEPSLRSAPADPRTPRPSVAIGEYDGRILVGGGHAP